MFKTIIWGEVGRSIANLLGLINGQDETDPFGLRVLFDAIDRALTLNGQDGTDLFGLRVLFDRFDRALTLCFDGNVEESL